MKRIPISCMILFITLPALLVLAQINRVDTFERSIRTHVPQSGFVASQGSIHAPKYEFYVAGSQHATWLSASAIEASPDWQASDPLPLTLAQVEKTSRLELARLVTNDAPWSVTSFQLHSIAGRQSLKWYFLVEMRPFWEPGPAAAERSHDSFWLCVDFSGKPGMVGRKVGDNQWNILR